VLHRLKRKRVELPTSKKRSRATAKKKSRSECDVQHKRKQRKRTSKSPGVPSGGRWLKNVSTGTTVREKKTIKDSGAIGERINVETQIGKKNIQEKGLNGETGYPLRERETLTKENLFTRGSGSPPRKKAASEEDQQSLPKKPTSRPKGGFTASGEKNPRKKAAYVVAKGISREGKVLVIA